MVFAYIPLATAFIGTSVAAIWDVKTTEVPDQISYAMIAIAILFYGYQSIITGTIEPLLGSIAFGLAFLAFGAFMYYIGQWGGADGLILGAIGFLLPSVPNVFAQTFFKFPISYMVNMFIIGAIYLIVYGLLFTLKNKFVINGIKKEIGNSRRSIATIFAAIVLSSVLAGVILAGSIYGYLDMGKILSISIYPIVAASTLYLLWKLAKAVETYGFKERVPISKLKVGDMLMSEKKLVGVTEKQIKALKKSGKRYVDVKLGVPFAPAFPLALLATLIYGDIIFVLMSLV